MREKLRLLYCKFIFITSFLLNKFLKGYFNFIYRYIISKITTRQWKFLSEKLDIPGSMPFVSLNAPRWNTHALIATTGIISLKNTIEFRGLNLLNVNCQNWTIVIYSQPANHTVEVISNRNSYENNLNIVLKPGHYTLGMRLYNVNAPISLPAVLIDGKVSIYSRDCFSLPSIYPERIWNKQGLLYFFIHSYLHLALAGKIAVSEEFLNREYLPVGNPETLFRYGLLLKNFVLKVKIHEELFSNCIVFITIYNFCSFPIRSDQLTQNHQYEFRAKENTTYLIRVIPIHDIPHALDEFLVIEQNLK